MSRTALTLTACLSLTTAFAHAQTQHPLYVPVPYGVHTVHHASTAEESFARGAADVIRARGQCNLMTSQALVHQAEARRRQIENHLSKVDAYFAAREANRRARYGTQSSCVPQAAQTNNVTSSHSGQHATASSSRGAPLHTTNCVAAGQLNWPNILQDERFANHRQIVDRLVAKRYTYGSLPDEERSLLTQATRSMAYQLKMQIGEYPANDYLEAKHLLTRLAI